MWFFILYTYAILTALVAYKARDYLGGKVTLGVYVAAVILWPLVMLIELFEMIFAKALGRY